MQRSSVLMSDFEVCLHTKDAGSFHGSLVDLAASGSEMRAVIDFPRPKVPTLSSKEDVTVVFAGGSLQRPLRAVGRPTVIDEDDESLRYEFLFGPETGSALEPIENRRESVRVRPCEDKPGGGFVQKTEGGPGIKAHVYDISATGVSILVSREEAQSLRTVEKLRVALLLADQPRPLDLIGTVRYRRAAGRAVQFGLEFDPSQSSDFDAQRKSLLGYVEGRLK